MDAREFDYIYKYIVSKSYSEQLTKDQKRVICKKAVNYKVIGDKLFRSSPSNQLLVVQTSELGCILKEIHDKSGHQYVRYSFDIAKDRYYWSSMYKDIQTYVNTCVRCQKNQPSLKGPTAPIKPLPKNHESMVSRRHGSYWSAH